MIELGVNIDHVATVRNARGTPYPDPIEAARLAEEAGADLITLHLREDRRHIRDADLQRLRPCILTRMNLECAITTEMLAIACTVKPHDVCLVPERRQEVTTEGGLDVRGHRDAVARAIEQLSAAGIRVSLFIDPDTEAIRLAAELGAPVVELHTGRYAELTLDAAGLQSDAARFELDRIRQAAELGCTLGLRVNAGHGLTRANLGPVAALDTLAELNIGHAIVADALFMGWQPAIKAFKAAMIAARAPRPVRA